VPLMSVNMIKQSTHSETLSLKPEVDTLLVELGVEPIRYTGGTLMAKTPITGETVAHVREVDAAGTTIERAHAAFLEWRLVPAPKRGELVRLLGEELRADKRALGRLVSIEAGKIESEGLGEVQEMIDICDYAVGLSRQLYGLTIATERHEHRMLGVWDTTEGKQSPKFTSEKQAQRILDLLMRHANDIAVADKVLAGGMVTPICTPVAE
jgi:L-aminoadipate-semialdehyde dehydrogenase